MEPITLSITFDREWLPLIIAAGLALFFYVTWVGYLAVMNLKRNWDYLSPAQKRFAYPLVVVFLFLDVLFNVIFGTWIFRELPQWHRGEWLMTGRLKRHIRSNDQIKKRKAQKFCEFYLNKGDPSGDHC